MKNLGYLVYFISLLVISSFSHNAVGQEVVITTSEGVMKARLYENVPNHVKTFIERARSGLLTERYSPVSFPASSSKEVHPIPETLPPVPG